MIPNPIRKVLSSFRKNRVRALLMGGQACIVYGAAEFSRDVDLAVLSSAVNLSRLQNALKELEAKPIFVPPLDASYLSRGHACHFRCHVEEAYGLRIDVMSVLRGCDPFEDLWTRRQVVVSPDLGRVNLLSLPDLVVAKKTQRDKDWLMVRRLLEADYFAHRAMPDPKQVDFWLREMRTPELVVELSRRYPARTRRFAALRPLLTFTMQGDLSGLTKALREEEDKERLADREYWQPLRRELEALRQQRTSKSSHGKPPRDRSARSIGT